MLVTPQVRLHPHRTHRERKGTQRAPRKLRLQVGAHARFVVILGRFDFGRHANPQSRPGERMAIDLRGIEPQGPSQLAHFRLVEILERFHHFPLPDHLLHERHAVMMGLDDIRPFRASRLDRVGINRALPEQRMLEV